MLLQSYDCASIKKTALQDMGKLITWFHKNYAIDTCSAVYVIFETLDNIISVVDELNHTFVVILECTVYSLG